MTEPDWDDDRLAAAFHARFDRPAPQTVARAVHGAIAGTSPARVRAFRRFPVRNLGAAAIVVLLVGSVAIAFGDVGRLGGGPSLPSDSASSPGVTPTAVATPTEQALPGSVLDMPIIRVSDAIAIRDAGVDDRELAVMGWFTPTIAAQLRCAAPAPVSPVQLGCGDSSIWLTQQAESLIHRTATSLQTTAPVGPAIKPVLDVPDWSPWLPPDFGIGPNGDSTPTDVVFIGHFDDRRAAFCPEAQQAACRDRFVVDSVARVAGQAPPNGLGGAPHVSSLPEIEAIIGVEAPQSEILSMLVTQYPEDLAFIEPSLAGGQAGLIDQAVLWIVRVLETERAVTYIVVDGTDTIYKMNPENEPVEVGGGAPAPVATLPRYRLDCGPLGPDTCQQKAAGIVAVNATGSPTKRLESITFFDECGSYTAIFNDGTGMTASIDCILP